MTKEKLIKKIVSITLTNDFHGTSAVVRIDADKLQLSHSQVMRARRKLCPSSKASGCTCGEGPALERPQQVKLIYQAPRDEYNNYVIIWGGPSREELEKQRAAAYFRVVVKRADRRRKAKIARDVTEKYADKSLADPSKIVRDVGGRPLRWCKCCRSHVTMTPTGACILCGGYYPGY